MVRTKSPAKLTFASTSPKTRMPIRKGSIAIVPGDPDASDLVYLIQSDDEDEQMPPPKSKKFLSKAEKKLLEKWIEQGGKYEAHWAFSKPEKAEPPSIAKHPIDAFVRKRLKEAGLKPLRERITPHAYSAHPSRSHWTPSQPSRN